MPRHIGIILDGNRRHVQHAFAIPQEIYRRGAEKLDDVPYWCAELSIPAVTLWVFSTNNFNRSPTEVSSTIGVDETVPGSDALQTGFNHRNRRDPFGAVQI